MAVIVYGVCGEGAGHAIRSDTIIKELGKDHDIHIFAAERAHDILKDRYPKVYQIPGDRFIYENNKVRYGPTVRRYIKLLPENLVKFVPKTIAHIKKIEPDIVITDFENTIAHIARLLFLPLLSIDNIQQLRKEKISSIKGRIVKYSMMGIQPRADKYIITTIDKKKDTSKYIYTDPVIRREVRSLEPSTGNHILVYQTSATNRQLLRTLQGRDCIVYGFDREESKGTIKFRRFNQDRFLQDLSSANYVISNGGFTVLTESLYLGKPVLVQPIKDQIEQELNSSMITRLGLGLGTERITKLTLSQFEKSLDSYKQACESLDWEDPMVKIRQTIASFLDS
ncbi:hypothetical protein H6504_02815 [Candidatus Woesearchaeota archaeon]|nr:hypothetical protein [Candidatus Woesearchaeota archaeon]